MNHRLKAATRQAIAHIFARLDYPALGRIYCHDGGEAFWRAKRGPSQRWGIKLAGVLQRLLPRDGRSLYVGAGVAEIPMLTMETLELGREVAVFNLRAEEVRVLNQALQGLPFRFVNRDAGAAPGRVDHLWIVSVLNDPERFPNLSALSYGRALPLTFDPARFSVERRLVRHLVDRCLRKLTLPGLVTTSTEEVMWIAEWCHKRRIPYQVSKRDYPAAVVGDPICFLRLGDPRRNVGKSEGRTSTRPPRQE
ncbi:MAG: hypothetical protein HZB35_12320 [Nitrospirae bacterium]|nr:hypothetical protein [Nitrospirota bacterium]